MLHRKTFNIQNAQKQSKMENNNDSWVRFQNDVVERGLPEPLFEKTLTPSDVGKLNRLVIPKQHAEKHFPLTSGGDSTAAGTSGEKGVLLCFEDEEGQEWRFRYSYWNSSQSYVLTKGWSRYVKEKQLDAGDVVFFHRHRSEGGGKLFIGRRRHGVSAAGDFPPMGRHVHDNYIDYHHSEYSHAGQIENRRSASGNSKTLRLFGVNLECQPIDEPLEPSDPSDPFQHSFPGGSTNNHSLYSYQPFSSSN